MLTIQTKKEKEEELSFQAPQMKTKENTQERIKINSASYPQFMRFCVHSEMVNSCYIHFPHQ